MVKHIIMLALCFMVYIIINIDTLTAQRNNESRKQEFELLVKCYEQMFENKLIKGIIELHKNDNDTFQTVLTNFYESYEIKTITDCKGNIVPSVQSEKFESDESLDSFRGEFINDFVQSGDTDEFQNKIKILTEKSKKDELVFPLKKFVLEYKSERVQEYLRTPLKFCSKYSVCPTFKDELVAQRLYDFELAVTCYKQMFENGLIKGIIELHKNDNDTFQTVLTNFYTSYDIITEYDNNGDILPSVNSEKFESDESLDSFRGEFINDFVQSGDTDEFQNKIKILTEKSKKDELVFPLKKFVLEYKSERVQEYLRTPLKFCSKYSVCPTFKDELVAQRLYDFELAVTCYKQMFENGLIKGIIELHKNDNDTFQTVLTNFYTSYDIITEYDNNGDILPSVNSEKFESDESLDSFRGEFINDFVQSGDTVEFQNKIKILTEKSKKDELVFPLKKFVLEYKSERVQEYLRTPLKFCSKYSVCPTFKDELVAQRLYDFELAVTCYKQMFENGLIKGIIELHKNDNDTFQTVLTNFYTSYDIITEYDNNGDILPSVNSEKFESDESLDSFRGEFINDFVQSGDTVEFQNKIKILTEKSKKDELVSPLATFVHFYDPNSAEAHITTPKAFCLKYSSDPESFKASSDVSILGEHESNDKRKEE